MNLKKEIKFKDLLPKRGKKDAADAPTQADEKPAKAKRSFSFARKAKPAGEQAGEQAQEKKQKPSRKPAKAKRDRLIRHKRLVGLKVGASQLAAAHVVNNGSSELIQVARRGLDPGIIVAGELREPEALVEALKAFFKEHKLPKQAVRLGIASNRIGVRTFDIGDISDPKQLENAIRFRAQETLPIPLEEAVLDYQILGESIDEEGKKTHRVLLVVAYRDLVDRYVAACKKAGIKLVGIDLEAFALLRALGDRPDEGNAAIVVVSVGSERSTLAVSNGESCEFTRVIDWGGQNLNVVMARAMDITPGEAEPAKLALSLLEPAEAMQGVDPEKAAKVRTAVHEELQLFVRELVSSLQFYQGQPGSLGIGEVVLTGGTAQMPGLDAELGRLLGVQVRIGDPLARVKLGKKVERDFDAGSLAVAIGLGMEV